MKFKKSIKGQRAAREFLPGDRQRMIQRQLGEDLKQAALKYLHGHDNVGRFRLTCKRKDGKVIVEIRRQIHARDVYDEATSEPEIKLPIGPHFQRFGSRLKP